MKKLVLSSLVMALIAIPVMAVAITQISVDQQAQAQLTVQTPTTNQEQYIAAQNGTESAVKIEVKKAPVELAEAVPVPAQQMPTYANVSVDAGQFAAMPMEVIPRTEEGYAVMKYPFATTAAATLTCGSVENTAKMSTALTTTTASAMEVQLLA